MDQDEMGDRQATQKAWVKRRHTSPSDLWRTVEQGIKELDQIDKSTDLGKAIVEFFMKY